MLWTSAKRSIIFSVAVATLLQVLVLDLAVAHETVGSNLLVSFIVIILDPLNAGCKGWVWHASKIGKEIDQEMHFSGA